MSELYNQEVSKHYGAYRPPIHEKILHQVFADFNRFEVGLDVGCGTGVSTVPLSQFCQVVYGVEPSEAMLAQAQQRDNIHYSLGTGEALPFADSAIDVVTFAGSLFYAKSDALVKELARVCCDDALIVVYDFDVLMGDYMQLLGIDLKVSAEHYDHAINFDDYDQFDVVSSGKNLLAIEVSSRQLAHVLFSSTKRLVPLMARFGGENSFETVVAMLDEISVQHQLMAETYVSVYRLPKLPQE
ncbi:class I SAM-dependent methyltransferase [Vibrio taketomensis]|uniref:class I SAM-dependent methyltransferase n=1 Tax=Vibrio taketomensis TaxID=2572923 RepID=UPI001389C013|nr:class I SAM-dependent methyltransferase [Vibrio taketomensis]